MVNQYSSAKYQGKTHSLVDVVTWPTVCIQDIMFRVYGYERKIRCGLKKLTRKNNIIH